MRERLKRYTDQCSTLSDQEIDRYLTVALARYDRLKKRPRNEARVLLELVNQLEIHSRRLSSIGGAKLPLGTLTSSSGSDGESERERRQRAALLAAMNEMADRVHDDYFFDLRQLHDTERQQLVQWMESEKRAIDYSMPPPPIPPIAMVEPLPASTGTSRQAAQPDAAAGGDPLELSWWRTQIPFVEDDADFSFAPHLQTQDAQQAGTTAGAAPAAAAAATAANGAVPAELTAISANGSHSPTDFDWLPSFGDD
jgi:hypothetical protein